MDHTPATWVIPLSIDHTRNINITAHFGKAVFHMIWCQTDDVKGRLTWVAYTHAHLNVHNRPLLCTYSITLHAYPHHIQLHITHVHTTYISISHTLSNPIQSSQNQSSLLIKFWWFLRKRCKTITKDLQSDRFCKDLKIRSASIEWWSVYLDGLWGDEKLCVNEEMW